MPRCCSGRSSSATCTSPRSTSKRSSDSAPSRQGSCFIPATLTVIVTSTQLTRRVLPHLGVRKILLAGLTSVAIGQIWLSTISSTGSYQLNVLGGVLLTAFGMGLTFPTASVAITAGVGPGERGLAGGLFVTSQQIGQAIGLAVLATVAAAVTNAHHGSLASGYRAAYLVAIGFAVLAVLIVAILMRARRSPAALRNPDRWHPRFDARS